MAGPIVNHMVKYSAGLDATFAALADPTRRAILASLALGESTVSELAGPHRMSLPAVMKHLNVLEHAGLVAQKKTGRVRRCSLESKPLKEASDWIAEYRVFWEAQFDSLEKFLQQEKEECQRKQPRKSKQ
jgi:DNA-binding transcriptional ArsR family regulator